MLSPGQAVLLSSQAWGALPGATTAARVAELHVDTTGGASIWASCSRLRPCRRESTRAPALVGSLRGQPAPGGDCRDERLLLPPSRHSRPAGELPGLKGAELELFQGGKNTEPGFQINLLTSTLKRASPQPPTAEPSPSTWALSLGTGCPRGFSKRLSPLWSMNA